LAIKDLSPEKVDEALKDPKAMDALITNNEVFKALLPSVQADNEIASVESSGMGKGLSQQTSGSLSSYISGVIGAAQGFWRRIMGPAQLQPQP
jgi:hypothetical protein